MKSKPKNAQPGKLEAALQALKRKMMLDAVKRQGDLHKAAKELGVTYNGLYTMLRRYGYRSRVKVTRTVELIEPKK